MSDVDDLVEEQATNKLHEVRIQREIGTDATELAAVAEEVIQGKTIAHARIKSLPALIEAVQRHSHVRAAPPREKRSSNWRAPAAGTSAALTEIRIEGGEIVESLADNLDCRVAIHISRAIFSANAVFTGVSFAGTTFFSKAGFPEGAEFGGASFADSVAFDGAQFGGEAWFGEASFAASAFFGDASFTGPAGFVRVSFAGTAWFDDAIFAGPATFVQSTFRDNTSFERARFMMGGWFSGVSFAQSAVFEGADFARPARVDDGRWLDVRQAEFGEPLPRNRLVRALARTFGWTTVRGVGQLQILTRVSIIALITVPVLATLTETLQAHIPTWPPLGFSMALTFFAALFVTLGQTIYQMRTPELVRKQDEDAFVEWMQRRYPEGHDRADGLRRATDSLAAIARLRRDRHPTFVRHHNETVWIPPHGRIDLFQDLPAPLVLEDTDTATPDWRKSAGTMPGAERARIAIEEGARAEYWLAGRQSLGWAWLSFSCYGIAVTALFVILLIQSYAVGRAAGWGWWGLALMVLLVGGSIGLALGFNQNIGPTEAKEHSKRGRPRKETNGS